MSISSHEIHKQGDTILRIFAGLKDDGTDAIEVKVNRQDLVKNSGFFQRLLAGNFAESHLAFDTSKPPIVALEETHHIGALIVLQAFHNTTEFLTLSKREYSYDLLKIVCTIADQWSCAEQAEVNVQKWIHQSLEIAFRNETSDETQETIDKVFREQLVGFFELARIVNCPAAAEFVAWYAVFNFDEEKGGVFFDAKNGYECISEPEFSDELVAKSFMTSVRKRYCFIKSNMIARLRDILVMEPRGKLNKVPDLALQKQKWASYVQKFEAAGLNLHEEKMERSFAGSILDLGDIIETIIHGEGSQAIGYVSCDLPQCRGLECRCTGDSTRTKLAEVMEWRKLQTTPFCLSCSEKSLNPWRCGRKCT